MSVGVLVESTLPGMVGVSEVALGVESLGDGLMVGELLAVVIGGLGPGLAADESQTLRLLGTVAAKTVVAPDLVADRGLVTLQHGCNLALGMTHFQKRLNLVAFFLGELHVISHWCAHACWFERLSCERSVPLFTRRGVALTS